MTFPATLSPRRPKERVTKPQPAPAPPANDATPAAPALMLAARDAVFYAQQMRLARMAGMSRVAEGYRNKATNAESLVAAISKASGVSAGSNRTALDYIT